MWDLLAPPWRVCLEQAWAAYGAGSLPIGAAIMDPEGTVLARGRNRIYEDSGPPHLLWGHRLAHAEMNALISLDRQHDERQPCVLFSTTEPCPLCTGAIRQYGVQEVRYASRDPAGGSIELLRATLFMRRREVTVGAPELPELEAAIMAMHTEFWLCRRGGNADWWLFALWEAVVPAGMELGRILYRTYELRQMCEAGTPVAQVINRLTAQAWDLGVGE